MMIARILYAALVIASWVIILMIGFAPPSDQPSHDASAFLVWSWTTLFCSVGAASRYWHVAKEGGLLIFTRAALWYSIVAVITNMAILGFTNSPSLFGPFRLLVPLWSAVTLVAFFAAPAGVLMGWVKTRRRTT